MGSWVQHEGSGLESSDLLAAPASARPTRSRCPRTPPPRRGPVLAPRAPTAAKASNTSSSAHARVKLDGLAPTPTPMACKAATRCSMPRSIEVTGETQQAAVVLPFDEQQAFLARCVLFIGDGERWREGKSVCLEMCGDFPRGSREDCTMFCPARELVRPYAARAFAESFHGGRVNYPIFSLWESRC